MTEIAEEWFERGRHEIETAKLLFEKEGYPEVILFHIHQAMEKYLKGFLIQNGWKLKKIHDLETLLTEAMDFDKEMEKYLDLGRRLTLFYYEERYPPGAPLSISRGDVEYILESVEEFIEKLGTT